jgi:hypothetical protein
MQRDMLAIRALDSSGSVNTEVTTLLKVAIRRRSGAAFGSRNARGTNTDASA